MARYLYLPHHRYEDTLFAVIQEGLRQLSRGSKRALHAEGSVLAIGQSVG
jgi:hypothetical protein